MGFFASDQRHTYNWIISLRTDFTYEILQRYFIDDIEQTPTTTAGAYQVLGDTLKMENFPDALIQLGTRSSQITLPMNTIVGSYEATFRSEWRDSDLQGNPLCP